MTANDAAGSRSAKEREPAQVRHRADRPSPHQGEHTMEGTRFDALTRRALGGAAGSLAASLLAIGARHTTAAKKKRCKKLTQACRPGSKKKRCCKNLRCGELFDLSGTRCCRPLRAVCGNDTECCGSVNGCAPIQGLGAQARCCGSIGASCTSLQDCCDTFACSGGE